MFDSFNFGAAPVMNKITSNSLHHGTLLLLWSMIIKHTVGIVNVTSILLYELVCYLFPLPFEILLISSIDVDHTMHSFTVVRAGSGSHKRQRLARWAQWMSQKRHFQPLECSKSRWKDISVNCNNLVFNVNVRMNNCNFLRFIRFFMISRCNWYSIHSDFNF